MPFSWMGRRRPSTVAREEARRLDLSDRIEFVEGDFVKLAAAIEPADIVTLDRVVCCYPDAEALVGGSAARVRTVYGLVLPRDRFMVRIAIRLENLWLRLRRKAYRAYVHPTARIDEIVAAAGLRPRAERHTAVLAGHRLRPPSGRRLGLRRAAGRPRARVALLAHAP